MRAVWVVSSSRIKIGQGGVCLHNNGEGSSGRIEGYAGVGCARFFAHHSDIKRIRYKMLRKKSSAPYELFFVFDLPPLSLAKNCLHQGAKSQGCDFEGG